MLNVDTVSVSISFIVTNFPPNQINKVVCLFYQSCFTDDSQHQPSSLDDRCVFCDAWKIKVTNATWHSAPFVKTLVFIGFLNNYFFLLSVAQNVLRFLIWASHSGILWCQNHNCVFFFSFVNLCRATALWRRCGFCSALLLAMQTRFSFSRHEKVPAGPYCWAAHCCTLQHIWAANNSDRLQCR